MSSTAVASKRQSGVALYRSAFASAAAGDRCCVLVTRHTGRLMAAHILAHQQHEHKIWEMS